MPVCVLSPRLRLISFHRPCSPPLLPPQKIISAQLSSPSLVPLPFSILSLCMIDSNHSLFIPSSSPLGATLRLRNLWGEPLECAHPFSKPHSPVIIKNDRPIIQDRCHHSLMMLSFSSLENLVSWVMLKEGIIRGYP